MPHETLEMLVHGEVSWVVDNPGRQQIGSFHPITDEDWKEGASVSVVAEKMTNAAVNHVDSIEALFKSLKRFLT